MKKIYSNGLSSRIVQIKEILNCVSQDLEIAINYVSCASQIGYDALVMASHALNEVADEVQSIQSATNGKDVHTTNSNVYAVKRMFMELSNRCNQLAQRY